MVPSDVDLQKTMAATDHYPVEPALHLSQRAAEVTVIREVGVLSTVILREARVEDALAIAEVSVASRQSARRGLYADSYLESLSPDPLAAEVRDFLEKPADGWRMWVAEDAGHVIAFAKAGPWTDGGSNSVAELDELYVEPSRFRQGVGTRLLRCVELSSQQRGSTAQPCGPSRTIEQLRRSTSRTGGFRAIDPRSCRRINRASCSYGARFSPSARAPVGSRGILVWHCTICGHLAGRA